MSDKKRNIIISGVVSNNGSESMVDISTID